MKLKAKSKLLSISFLLICCMGGITNILGAEMTKENYIAYYNSRFGFSVDIPSDFIPQRPPENDDGRVFLSEDGQAEIRVSAGANILNWTIYDIRDYLTDTAKGNITILGQGETWIAATWIDNESIYYNKSFISGDGEIQSSMNFIYPVEQRDRYDVVVEHLEETFKPAKFLNYNFK